MGKRLSVLLVISLLGLAAYAPMGGSDEAKPCRGPNLHGDDYPVWTDPLDDLSHVYVPDGGLVGVEVSGGEAHLLPGENEGWIASEIINAKPGYKYDFVYLEVVIPGSSQVEISILNATEESSEIGFANKTIDGFKQQYGTFLSLFSLVPSMYPQIRIQVNLIAMGTDRPIVLEWSLHYVPSGEWRDTFHGNGRMVMERGINITDGSVEINRSRYAAPVISGGYWYYPPVFFPNGGSSSPVFYPNAERTGYQDSTQFAQNNLAGLFFHDFNNDGLLDMVCAKTSDKESQILWGDSGNNWTTSGAIDFAPEYSRCVDGGDFNGDGEIDLAFANGGSSSTGSTVYLNNGGGDFDYRPNVIFSGLKAWRVSCGDLNSDGFDDILFSDTEDDNEIKCFFGGIKGPDTTVDITLPAGDIVLDTVVEDIDYDGHMDVVIATVINDRLPLYLGGPNGPDSTADIELQILEFNANVRTGDINGDGFLDLVCLPAEADNEKIRIFKGKSSGWTNNDYNDIPKEGWSEGLEVVDINLDGYDDILIGTDDSHFELYMGGNNWPTAPSIRKSNAGRSIVAVAMPETDSLGGISGSFITEEITRPIDKKWDILNLEGMQPDNTSFKLSVLDKGMDPIEGYLNLEMSNVDLSGIVTELAIHVKVTLWSETNSTTPILDSIIVKWMDKMTWREQFYGMAKVANLSGLDVRDGELQRAQETGGPESVSYLSQAFGPDVAGDAGSFHTLRYSARLGSSQSGTLRLVDAATSEVLAETPLQSGDREWSLTGAFSLKEHPQIQVNVTAEGLDVAGEFALDDLWLNWTKRVKLPPRVVSISVSEPSVYRLQTVTMNIEVADEYDLPGELFLNVEHRLNGTTTWLKYLLGTPMYKETEGVWVWTIEPNIGAVVGMYDFRVDVTDTDMLFVDNVEFPSMLEVLNNLPTTPVVHIAPSEPSTTSQLRVEFDNRSTDLESAGLEYRYRWYKNGELVTDLTGDIVDPSRTARGQNWSVEVRAWDGDDESEPALAWVLIVNAAPIIHMDLPDPALDEDTTDSDWLDLSIAFKDDDGDALTWSMVGKTEHLEVTIDPTTGKVTLAPEENWSGQENITFGASDGEASAWQTVTVYVTAVNDVPWFVSVNGEPVGDGPVEMTIKQGELLSIDVLVLDVEGDELVYDLNTTLFTIDEPTGSIRWQPSNDAVGTLRFKLTVWDTVTPSAKVSLDFIVEVENENDPMDGPKILSPDNGAKYKVNVTFSLLGSCADPDTRYGQVLNYSWSSNMSGHLGFGPSLSMSLQHAGMHVITLTVSDGEFQRTATVTMEIEPIEDITPPPEPEDGEDEGSNYLMVVGIVLVLVVVGAVFYVLSTKRKAEEQEATDEEEYKREHMERAYEAVKAAADQMEAAREGAPQDEQETMEVATGTTPDGQLSIQASITEVPSQETIKLFTGISTAEPVMSEEEQEQLRLDNLKRKYQNAIGRLPYGIPSPELKDRDWVELAAALATGEKKETPGGRELTMIDGRWYYSDVKDTGTFLKEHGAQAKPKAGEKRRVAVTTDKAALLAKLEERFILGEISEEAYEKLVEKYSEEEK